MKHLQLFENWSANFHNILQGAYAKAKETGLRHGKAAKDIEDYVKRNISTERFTIDSDQPFEGGQEFVISYQEKFLLEPLTVSPYTLPTMYVEIHERDGQKVWYPINMGIQLRGGKLMSPASNVQFRFKHRNELEDFIAMYVQAVVSDRTGKEFTQGQLDTLKSNGYTDGVTDITSSLTKNILLKQVNDVLQKDIRNLL
jgi:hypothetical protein